MKVRKKITIYCLFFALLSGVSCIASGRVVLDLGLVDGDYEAQALDGLRELQKENPAQPYYMVKLLDRIGDHVMDYYHFIADMKEGRLIIKCRTTMFASPEDYRWSIHSKYSPEWISIPWLEGDSSRSQKSGQYALQEFPIQFSDKQFNGWP